MGGRVTAEVDVHRPDKSFVPCNAGEQAILGVRARLIGQLNIAARYRDSHA